MDPCLRFLGVQSDADPLTLLGLPPERCDAASVDAALRDRLARVFRHPDGRSPDAEEVRKALRGAAEQLKNPTRRDAVVKRSILAEASGMSRPASPYRAPMVLTDFDRAVMAALVAGGGWNARSRSRLVALAAVHGVTVQGLLKVITGLCDYARSGGPKFGIADITGGGRMAATRAPAGFVDGSAELADRLGQKLAEDLKEGGVWPTVKLSILFGLVTIFVFIVALKLLLVSPPAPKPVDVHPVASSSSAATAPDALSNKGPPAETGPRVLSFRKPPTFLGNGLPVVATDAADLCPQLPDRFDEVARKLMVSQTPSEAVLRDWDDAVQTIATSWVLVDQSTRSAIDKTLFEALHAAASSPSVSDRLLASLIPPSDFLNDPIDLWRGSWKAGMLGAIADHSLLPPVVVEQARGLAAVALEQDFTGKPLGFGAAASIWLDRELPRVVDMLEINDRAYDFWELWLSAQRALGEGPRHEAALMDAIAAILRTGTDLSRPGPSVNVLGRLLSILDFEASPIVKERLPALFDDERIESHDLWVMTSLLAASRETAWLDESVVLPAEADQNHRWRIKDTIAKRWPDIEPANDQSLAQGRGIEVDAQAGKEWFDLAEQSIEQALPRTSEDLMRQLIAVSRVNEAAGFLASQSVNQAGAAIKQAQSLLNSLDSGAGPQAVSGQPGGLVPASVRVGQPIGVDGQWAAEYSEFAKNAEEKIQRLRSLRNTAGTDLGRIDAEAFVREVYRGSPQEVRSLAQAILTQAFSTGPIVAMELLDQFTEGAAPQTEGVSGTIARCTGRLLPSTRAPDWRREARRALLEHAMSLREGCRSEVDAMTASLIDSYVNRLAALKAENEPSAAPRAPEEAAELLADAWRRRAEIMITATPTPDSLAGLQHSAATRLQLAGGPLQVFVARQLAIADLMAYITVAEQPALREQVLKVLAEGQADRQSLSHVLMQAVEIERAIARLWMLRLTIPASTKGKAEKA